MSDPTPRALPLVMAEPRGRAKPPRHLADLSLAERTALAAELGLPPYRAKQLSTHYFDRLVDDPAEMTDLPAAQRDELVASLLPTLLHPVRTLEADRGTTRKTLWRLFDGALVESVLMRYPDRVTMCVSSQAGCGMACPFCATGQGGLQRNMSTAEIVEQVVAGARSLARGEVPGVSTGSTTGGRGSTTEGRGSTTEGRGSTTEGRGSTTGGAARPPGGACPTSCSWAWASRWPTTRP